MTSLDHSWEGKQRGTYLIFVFRKNYFYFLFFICFHAVKRLQRMQLSTRIKDISMVFLPTLKRKWQLKSQVSLQKHVSNFILYICIYIYSVNEVYINCHAEHPKVVSVFLNQGRQLHTTHSWEFMLMEKEIGGVIHPSSLWEKANFGEDIIIGNLDTGNFFSGLCFVPHYQYLFCHPMSAFTVVCRSYQVP